MHSRDYANSGVDYGTRSIRIGIMNTQANLQEWQARCLTNLLTLDKVQIVLSIIVNENRNSQTSYEKENHLDRVLFRFYSKWFFRASSTRIREMNKAFGDVPFMRCSAVNDAPSLSVNDEDVHTISTYDLDFILWFGSGTIRGAILNVARYGVWSFRHSAAGKAVADLPCFWEIYTDECSVGAALERMTDQDNSKVILKKGLWGICKYSHVKNIDEILFETAQWPARVCADILNGSGNYVTSLPSQVEPPVTHAPSNCQLLRFLMTLLKNRVIKIYNSLFCHDEWNIGISYEPIHAFLTSKPKIHYLPPPETGTFVADPFGIVKDNKLTIICEQFSYSSSKGIICSIELADGSHSCQPVPVLDVPVHVSYPYLIEYDDEVYCIPETAAAREIALYKAEQFPQNCMKVATLIDGIAASDATVFHYEGLWWLMCTDREKNAFVNLFAWYAAKLSGPWKPHAINPIKTDIHSARSAGTPFSHEGFLYRPAQDCSRTYGGRIVINRVIRLTPTEFSEEQVASIEPDADRPYPDGVHTISTVGNITLVDGKRVVFVGSAFKRAIFRGLTKIYQRTVSKRAIYPSQA